MIIDIENLNPGTWFDFDEDKPEKGAICVRHLSPEKADDFSEECTTKKRKFHKGRPYETSDFDKKKYDGKFWDYIIVDWKNLKDKDGTEIPCTAENKYKLVKKSPFFVNLVNNAIDKLEAAEAEFQEATEKN